VHIGLLEDDQSQIELIRHWGKEAGFTVHPYTNGNDFRQSVLANTYDLFILDWNLPDTTGIEVLDWLRSNIQWPVPILFITSRDSESDIVEALDHGSDDYIIKPVNKEITLARIKALLRRSKPAEHSNNLEFNPYNINLSERAISLNDDDEAIKLTNKEFDLALMLFRNTGRLISREYIMEHIWGTTADLNTRTVDTHISRIRSKLGLSPDKGWQLSSIYHHGYRLTKIEQAETEVEVS